MVGRQLGPYAIVERLGSGGMGEVYRAHDTRLGRDVAIKVLRPEYLNDERRRHRLSQEAQAIARLNHPNIVTIHEIDRVDDVDFIVMEYLTGQTLHARIPPRGMRVDEALSIAVSITDALAAAHARGIIHRDLKPSNIWIDAQGGIKVLDFGVAKLLDDEAGVTETVTQAGLLSRAGTIVGTIGYMSPEQASGGIVDARSDLFSLGSVLFEMVTGRRAFEGSSPSETLAALMRDQPTPPRELSPAVSPTLERIIFRCLRKDPARRFQHIGDVKLELEEEREALASGSSRVHPTVDSTVSSTFRRRTTVGAALAAGAAAIIAIVLWGPFKSEGPAPSIMRVSTERGTDRASFSPDGNRIVYAAAGEDGVNWDIYLRLVGQPESRKLTTDPAAEGYPEWSRDGNRIAFLRFVSLAGRTGVPLGTAGHIYVMSSEGEAKPRLVSEFAARLQLSWSKDGRWLAAAKAGVGAEPAGGIHLINVDTGEVRPLTVPKKRGSDLSPAFSPDGKSLAYLGCEGAALAPACDVYVQPLDAELRVQGPAVKVSRKHIWSPGLSWTNDGEWLLYSSDGIWRVRRDGGSPPVRIELAAEGRAPAMAAGRNRLVYVRGEDSAIYRLRVGGDAEPLIQSSSGDLQPQYSNDGQRIAFVSKRAGGGRNEVWLANADGTNITRLTHAPGVHQGSPMWSPDDKLITFDSQQESGHRDVWVIGASGTGLQQITKDPGDEIVPSWSHDGRFIYFMSDRSGRFEIWRTAADGSGSAVQVTTTGADTPFESSDGSMLVYRRSGGAVLSRPAGGGVEHVIVPCVEVFGFAPVRGGIVYHECLGEDRGASPRRTLYLWEQSTGLRRALGTVGADWINGVSASPGGKFVIYGRGIATADLMMIEGFR